jgi:hypothetical protein
MKWRMQGRSPSISNTFVPGRSRQFVNVQTRITVYLRQLAQQQQHLLGS